MSAAVVYEVTTPADTARKAVKLIPTLVENYCDPENVFQD